jgi:hypothetical protein
LLDRPTLFGMRSLSCIHVQFPIANHNLLGASRFRSQGQRLQNRQFNTRDARPPSSTCASDFELARLAGFELSTIMAGVEK